MKPRPLAPLLVTRCDLCCRRRVCIGRLWGYWVCRQCIRGLMPRLTAALRAFKEQSR